ncbi:hypothetical protein SCHPADRAFT_1001445 [Schizopora paradoxa]|uniref:BTB domain-containing protein n=1 Tax=Schizopora paradoxa TaxID=27342 RepID=A0A0H2R7B1_9AGAM|nr:hypothetical protein SCHPADRAFT_1001445 [Schizopora paradoxa]
MLGQVKGWERMRCTKGCRWLRWLGTMERMLPACYAPFSITSYYHRDADNTPLEVVVALLRLGTKYDFKGLRRDVILQILKYYPMSLCEFETAVDDHYALFGTTRRACNFPLFAEALATNTAVLLPSLFFACSDYEIPDIFEDAKCLTRDLISKLLVRRERIVLAKAQLVSTDLPECLREKPCNSSCRKEEFCLKNAFYSGSRASCTQSLLQMSGRWMVKKYLRGACESCESVVMKFVDSRRQKVWDDIPCYSLLPSWEELRRELGAMTWY